MAAKAKVAAVRRVGRYSLRLEMKLREVERILDAMERGEDYHPVRRKFPKLRLIVRNL
jgi:hypothetical protein